MPRLAICSHNLHWQWINWTLLCDTMEVSVVRLASQIIAQHMVQPALTGRLELISRKIVSCEQEQRLLRWAEKKWNCLPRIGSKELPRFHEKYCALGRQKMGSNMRPQYIQFREIHNCNISGVYCTIWCVIDVSIMTLNFSILSFPVWMQIRQILRKWPWWQLTSYWRYGCLHTQTCYLWLKY